MSAPDELFAWFFRRGLVGGMMLAGVAVQAVAAPSEFPLSQVSPLPERQWPAYALRMGTGIVSVTCRVSGYYDDNLLLSPSRIERDWVTSVSPQVLLVKGEDSETSRNLLRFRYAPTLNLFQRHSAYDGVDQVLSVSARHRGSRLSGGLSASYDRVDRSERDLVGRVTYETRAGAADADMRLSGRSAVEATAEWIRRDFDAALDSEEVRGHARLRVEVSERWDLAPGLSLGWGRKEDSADQQIRGASTRVRYRMSERTVFEGHAGIESRADDRPGSATRFEPIWSMTFWRRASPRRLWSLATGRETFTSALPGQDYFSASHFTGRMRQELARGFFFEARGSHIWESFRRLHPASVGERGDNRDSLRGDVGWCRGKFEIRTFYNDQRNDSSDAAFRFHVHRMGLEAAWGL